MDAIAKSSGALDEILHDKRTQVSISIIENLKC